jgi:hypothetical protein
MSKKKDIDLRELSLSDVHIFRETGTANQNKDITSSQKYTIVKSKT